MTTTTVKRLGLGLCILAGGAGMIIAAGPALTADEEPLPLPAPAPEPPKTPPVLAKAIADNRVTLAIIHSPGSILDDLAVREVRAGTALVSGKFLAVDTGKAAQIEPWVQRYPKLATSPTVLIFGQGSDVPITTLTEFSDREIVAQAVLNTGVQVDARKDAKASPNLGGAKQAAASKKAAEEEDGG